MDPFSIAGMILDSEFKFSVQIDYNALKIQI